MVTFASPPLLTQLHTCAWPWLWRKYWKNAPVRRPSLYSICSSYLPACNTGALTSRQPSPGYSLLSFRVYPPSMVDTVEGNWISWGSILPHAPGFPALITPLHHLCSPAHTAPSVLPWGTHDPHPSAEHMVYDFKYNLFPHWGSTCSKLASLRLNHPGPFPGSMEDPQSYCKLVPIRS